MSMVIKDILKVAQARFEDEGCLTPRLDAELLLLHMLNEDRTYLFVHFGDQLDEKNCDEYFKLVDIRASGTPLQHITGKQEFMGLPFIVNENVLIPRQDTELMVETAIVVLKNAKEPFGGFRILDLCCGSGAIAVSLAHHMQDKKLKVIATDISRKAIATAKQNADKNEVGKAIQFIEGDLFQPFPKNRKGEGKQKFDLILSNPPYIPKTVIPTLMREVRDHEPILALDGGPDGLDFYKRILNEAHSYLKDASLLLLEIGYDQGESVRALAADTGFYEPVEVQKDLAGKDRLVLVQKRVKM